MMEPLDDPMASENDGDYCFTGYPDGGRASSGVRIPAPRALPKRVLHVQAMPPRRPHRGSRLVLRVGEYLCLLVAIACLGYYGLDYGRALVVQSYQSWRFDRILQHRPAREMSWLMTWMDQALARLNGGHDQTVPHAASPVATAPIAPPAVPPVPIGSLIGRMEIPRIGISVMVLEGDSVGVLEEAAGHVPATAFPGGRGNVVIAGHRDTFFRALREIRKDDQITFTTTQGVYSYQVASTEKVGPEDVQVLSDPGYPVLTLITCYPFNFIGPAPKRFIVRASQIEAPQMGASGQNTALDAHITARQDGENQPDPTSRPVAPHPKLSLPSHSSTDLPPAHSDSHPMQNATTLAASNFAAGTTEHAKKTKEAQDRVSVVQQDDPSMESHPAPHNSKLKKVGGWFASIPRHLRQN